MTAQMGSMAAFGRQWTADLVRWRTPTSFRLPKLDSIPPPLQQQFILGLGTGLGERLGPGQHRVEGLSSQHIDSWKLGIKRGAEKRWIMQTR